MNFTINKVFVVDWPGKIFVREFLPAAVYGLLRRTKDLPRSNPDWVRSGEVYARKLDGSDVVVIRSAEYLWKIEWLILFDVFGFSRRP